MWTNWERYEKQIYSCIYLNDHDEQNFKIDFGTFCINVEVMVVKIEFGDELYSETLRADYVYFLYLWLNSKIKRKKEKCSKVLERKNKL